MLTYVCPVCKAEASLEVVIYAAVDDKDARRLVEYLVKTYQPTLGADSLRYLRLHTPAKQRMTWARVRKVLGDIVDVVRGRKVTHAGREWPVSVDDWSAAFQAVFDASHKGTLALPLKDNAYLYAVLVRRVDKSEAIAEAKDQQDKRNGPRAPHCGDDAQAIVDVVGAALGPGQRGPAPSGAAPVSVPTPRPTLSPAVVAMREKMRQAQEKRARLEGLTGGVQADGGVKGD